MPAGETVVSAVLMASALLAPTSTVPFCAAGVAPERVRVPLAAVAVAVGVVAVVGVVVGAVAVVGVVDVVVGAVGVVDVVPVASVSDPPPHALKASATEARERKWAVECFMVFLAELLRGRNCNL